MVGLPWDQIRDMRVVRILDQPYPIRGKYHNRVKKVEEPGEPVEIMLKAGHRGTYQTTVTCHDVSRCVGRQEAQTHHQLHREAIFRKTLKVVYRLRTHDTS